MENWRNILLGRLFKHKDPTPRLSETLQLPGRMPLELTIAQKIPAMERDLQMAAINNTSYTTQKLSIRKLVDFFGLQAATRVRCFPVAGINLPANFDFAVEEHGLGNTEMRATRIVTTSKQQLSLSKGKAHVDIPDNVRASTRLMTVNTANQAEVLRGDTINDEVAEIIILAQWSNPRLLPKIGIIYTELSLHIDRQVLYSSRRYGSLWEVCIEPERIQVAISPRRQDGEQQSFRLDFNGKLLKI